MHFKFLIILILNLFFYFIKRNGIKNGVWIITCSHLITARPFQSPSIFLSSLWLIPWNAQTQDTQWLNSTRCLIAVPLKQRIRAFTFILQIPCLYWTTNRTRLKTMASRARGRSRKVLPLPRFFFYFVLQQHYVSHFSETFAFLCGF